jgi:hypothetical protein
MEPTNYEHVTNYDMYNYVTVSYTMGMKTGNVKTCISTDFEASCKVKSNFEIIPDNVPV